MTWLWNDPADFVDEATAGLVAAHPDIVTAVPGGVVRTPAEGPATVAIIVGGGSGHAPAFAGLVGEGLAAGAAAGQVFASPSATQVEGVARAADRGAGVLFIYVNYAGDALNFREAAERLAATGVACATVAVTDDISSADEDARDHRRGIAGALFVIKAAGAAAAGGASLAEVARVAIKANERTRSLGVALSGCTLPGATQPLFTLPPDTMEIGMGIHGEPGLDRTSIPSSGALADLLVGRLLEPAPAGAEPGDRLTAIVNGLGAIKLEELYVLFHGIDLRLREQGRTLVEPEVGEFVTSFEMAGVSLSLCWLDDELEALWGAPAYAVGYRKGAVSRRPPVEPARALSTQPDPETLIGPASDASREAARRAVAAFAAVHEALESASDELGRLDAVAGDGDHGIGMTRGAKAAAQRSHEAATAGAGLGSTLRLAGEAWGDRGGGTSGALWGRALRTFGDALQDTDPTSAAFVAGVREAVAEIARAGGARPGDKTMLDALHAYAETLAGSATIDWSAAVDAARQAADATADMMPRVGRARPHAEASLGTPDPGAVSAALIVRVVTESVLGS